MDAPRFIVEFGHIANAPGGIAQLRLMIYQLAVTGLLISRGEDQSDAGSLLAQTESIRQSLIRDKQYKRIVKLERESIRIPSGIELPPTWRWSRLLDVGEINPRNDAQDEAAAAFLPMSGVPQRHRGPLEIEPTKWADIKQGYTHFGLGDVVLAKITPCFENGKAALISDLPDGLLFGAGTTELHVVRSLHPDILPGYLYLFLRSPLFTVEGEKRMTGTAGQKRLPTDYFATRALPLPPTEEQVRIVSKVDELMALCDTLEAQQQERRKLQNALRESTLQAVSSSTSTSDLIVSSKRLNVNFGRLFDVPEDIEHLRNLILELAVRGYLVEKRLEAEPVDEFLSRSIAAKQELLESGELKKRVGAATDVIQLDVDIPEHWEFAPLDAIFQFIDYRGNTPEKTETGVVLVTAKNVRSGYMSREPVEYMSEESYKLWMTRGFPKKGDLLFTTEAPLGNVAEILDEPSFALAQRVIDLQPFADLNTRCVMYFMMSPTFQQLLERNSSGMTAKGIKAAKLKQLLLPLPPIEEQARIVHRVEELLALCTRLKGLLNSSRTVSDRLAAAAVASLTGISLNQNEDEPVKAPETELLAPVRLSSTPSVNAQAPLAGLLARHDGEMSARDLWQRYGRDIDLFYAQLKREVDEGWIAKPEVAEMREKPMTTVGG